MRRLCQGVTASLVRGEVRRWIPALSAGVSVVTQCYASSARWYTDRGVGDAEVSSGGEVVYGMGASVEATKPQGASSSPLTTPPTPAAASHGPEGARNVAPRPEDGTTVAVTNHKGGAFRVQPIRAFSDVAEDLPSWLYNGIQSMGYAKPTTVQAYAIPLLMESKDVVGIAPTGSGKTVAFAIPALSTITTTTRRRNGTCEPSILVLCPTRELTTQTKNVFVALGNGKVMTRSIIGGQDREQQRQWLRQGADAVVATPGRLCDFLDTKDVSLEHVDFLVLDEADRMLEMGFAPQLKHIVGHLKQQPEKRRVTMMWSATWSKTVELLASGLLHPTERLTVRVEQKSKVNSDIKQLTYGVQDASQKLGRIVQMYEEGGIHAKEKVIVFANHKETVETIGRQLAEALRVDNPQLVQGLHGGMRQAKREVIMKKFRTGEIRVLVATDVAARGLDVPDIEHVINYDLPLETDRYVHRIGRTGRAGRKGVAHTLFCQQDGGLGSDLADFLHSNGVELSHEASEVVRSSRFRGDVRQYKRYDTRSAPVSPRNHLSEDCPTNDWRRSGEEAPQHRRGGDGGRSFGGGEHSHYGGRGGGRRDRGLRVITLKRDS